MELHPVLLFLMCAGIRGVDASNETSLDMTTLITWLQKLCPGADVCPENKTITIPKVTFPPGYESCCTDCSCAPDCMEYGTCCFPDKVPLRQPNVDSSSFIQTRCILTSTSSDNSDQRILQSYNMVVSIHKVKTDDGSLTNTTCGDENVALWGSLYPVYSPKRRRIYKNNVCALADNVDDGLLWDAMLVCDKNEQESYGDASKFVQSFESGSLSSNCRVDFLFQGNKEELQPLQCSDHLIDDCTAAQTYELPYDLTYDLANDACTSGLVSPFMFTKQRQYINVFCYICNGEHFPNERVNPIYISRNSFYGNGFIALIDQYTMQTFVMTAAKQGTFPQACVGQKAENCRNVLCPSGQVRDSTGKCRYPNKIWYNQQFILILEMRSETSIDVIEMFMGENDYPKTSEPDIELPWKKIWSIRYVYCLESHYQLGKTKTLYMLLGANPNKINPTIFFERTQNMLNEKSHLKSKEQSHEVTSKIKKDFSFDSKNTTLKIGNSTMMVGKDSYRILYFNPVNVKNVQAITKLYLCNQVELLQSEFITSQDGTVLFNAITGKLLYSGEFTILYDTNETVRARVCVEDSGFNIINSSSLGTIISLNILSCIFSAAWHVCKNL